MSSYGSWPHRQDATELAAKTTHKQALWIHTILTIQIFREFLNWICVWIEFQCGCEYIVEANHVVDSKLDMRELFFPSLKVIVGACINVLFCMDGNSWCSSANPVCKVPCILPCFPKHMKFLSAKFKWLCGRNRSN